MSERTCKVCGAVLVRRPNEWNYLFDKRQTCGNECKGGLLKGPRKPRQAKFCQVCGKVMNPDDYPLKMGDWRKRKTCSAECGRKLVGAKNSATLATGWRRTARKQCPVCGETFLPREGEERSKFKLRAFCSPECKGINHRKEADTVKACSWCGASFLRREGEKVNAFRKRLTCCKECGVLQRRHNRIKSDRSRLNPYPAEWTPQLRKMIRDRDANCCQLCGATRGQRELSIHHIDYNKQNLDPMNLVTLCHTCHMQTNYDRPYWEALLTTYMAEREDQRAA